MDRRAAALGEADEDETHAGFGVHGEVGQQAQVFEGIVAQVVRLVDDEDGQLSGLLCKAGDFDTDGVMGRGTGALAAEAELPGDGLVHVEHVAGAQGDVVHAIQAWKELCGEVSAHGGLSAAELSGEQADAFEFDEVVEPGLGLAPGVGFEQLVGVGGGLARASG